MVKFQTAEMSHEQIRSRVQVALDKKYPVKMPEPVDYDKMPWAMDVYDGYVIHTGGPGKGLFKQKYSLKDGECELMGEPEEVEPGYVTKASLAAAKVTTGDDADAQALMAELCDKNPLLASIKDSPNTHLIMLDLTSIGKPSRHQGQFHYQLAKSGIKSAIASLISKPIHVTAGLDGHFTAGKDPVAIGAFLGGVVIDQPDGSWLLRAIGTLWDDDFPETVKDIQEKKAELGASYEIAYLAASASRLTDKVIEIGKYEFSGGAILLKTAAAHQETALLMASKDSSKAREIISESIRLHEKHMGDPTTATAKSQKDLMDMLKQAKTALGSVLMASEDTTMTFDVPDEEQYPRLLAYLRGGTSFTQADTLSYKERSGLSDSDFALIQTVDDRKIRRFPIHDEAHRKNAWARLPQAKNLSDAERSEVRNKVINKAKSAGDDWAKDYKKSGGEWTKGTPTKGGASMKFKGIPEELEAVVEALLSTTTKEAVQAFEAKIAAAEPDSDDMPPAMKKKMKMAVDAAVAAAAAPLTAEVERLKPFEAKTAELTAALEVSKTAHETAQTALDKIAGEQKMAATLTALKADYGLTDAQLKEDKRAPLVAKLAAGKEPLSVEEWKQLMTGAQVPGSGQRVPLFAGGGDPGAQAPDPEAIKKNFPNAVKKTFR